MKNMKENSPLKDLCPEKKITNHSARKTVVKKLKSSGVPKCEIKNITGHTTAQGLDDYDSGDEREQQVISNIIDNGRPSSSRGVLSQLYPVNSLALTAPTMPGQIYNFSHCSVTWTLPAIIQLRKVQASVEQSADTSESLSKTLTLISNSCTFFWQIKRLNFAWEKSISFFVNLYKKAWFSAHLQRVWK